MTQFFVGLYNRPVRQILPPRYNIINIIEKIYAERTQTQEIEIGTGIR